MKKKNVEYQLPEIESQSVQEPVVEYQSSIVSREIPEYILNDIRISQEEHKRGEAIPVSDFMKKCMETKAIRLNENIRKMLPKVRQYLSGQPVLRAWLFGSYSRGEETADSDVDILVQYKDTENISLFTISRIMCSLTKLLNRKVDLVEADGLLPFAAESANHDRILIYEREN